MRRALNAILAEPWAIKPEWLGVIAEIAQRDADEPALLIQRIADRLGETPETVQKRLGQRLENTRQVRERGGVAIISVVGPIFPRANLISEFSGGTSLNVLATDLQAVIENDDIRAILLDVDSPGGAATGIAEMAEMIFAARQVKQVTAYIGGVGASAAYWLAAAAAEVVINDTGLAGSVGVVTALHAQEAPDQDGFLEFEIVSSNAANKRPDPRTAEGQATVQTMLDQFEEVFLDRVARYRGLAVARIIEDWDHGGMLVGTHAVAAGMADRLGTFEEVLAGLAAGRQAGAVGVAAGAKVEDSMVETTKTETAAPAAPVADAEEHDSDRPRVRVPAVTQQIEGTGPPVFTQASVDASTARATEAERERVAAVLALCSQHEASADLTQRLVSDGTSVGKAAEAILAERNDPNLQALADMRQDLPAEARAIAASDGSEPPALSPETPVEERCKALWARDAKLRGEFLNFEDFVAYTKANEAGHIKILKRPAEATV